MNIIVDLNYPIKDGTEVVFRSPVDCSQVTGLIVYYPNGSQEFAFADAHGNNVGDIDNLFAENVAVKVILDVTTGMAFVQNADTNAYLEGRFDLLADSIVSEATGNPITLNDSANRKLQGLRIIGKYDENGLPLGENGDITVKVMGKNIADLRKVSAKDLNTASTSAVLTNSFGTSLSATSGDSITVTQSKWPNAQNPCGFYNGYVVFGFYCPVRVGDVVTISFDYEITNNPLNVTGGGFTLQLANGYQSAAGVKGNKIYITQYINSSTIPQADGWVYVDFRNCGTSGVISNFQVEYGKTATEYEPYKEQTLTVSTFANGQSGLAGDNDIWDEIDFANGVLIHRSEEQATYPLPDDVLEAYAKLHTNKPFTTIVNDEGAKMVVEYVADTKTYIDNKFTELQNAILSSGANV